MYVYIYMNQYIYICMYMHMLYIQGALDSDLYV